MADNIENAIVSALEGDAISFKDSIHAALADKVQGALNLKKVEYSSPLFADEQDEEGQNQEEDSDETVQ